jgi:glycosyltransferase involved in cell wall biosynthesis
VRPVSVVIPAHDEEQVIDRCLDALLGGAEPGEVEVVVACNGCTDRTAEIAGRREGVVVLQVPEASKVAALNAGDAAATRFPRFYVDADVELPIAVLREVAEVLDGGAVHCAAPRPVFEVRGRPWAIRAFYDIWQRLPFLNDAPIGNGVYALSATGRSRFQEFPALTSDDLFVRNLFTVAERRTTDTGFTVHTPTSVRGLLKMRTRVHRGNRELHRSVPLDPQHGSRGSGFAAIARQPRLLPSLAVYLGINLLAKVLGTWKDRRGESTWERDDSARAAA